MGIGRMQTMITIVSKTVLKDAEGFGTETTSTVLNARAYREHRHGSAAWRNRASFVDATDLFVIRAPRSIHVKTNMAIVCNGMVYQILNVENVKERGMYLEILASEVVPSGKV